MPAKNDRGWRSSDTAPFCNGVGACTTRLSWTARNAGVRSGGVITQPTRQPVARPVFEIEFTTSVHAPPSLRSAPDTGGDGRRT